MAAPRRWLARARILCEMSQREVAEQITKETGKKTSRSWVGMVEQGRRPKNKPPQIDPEIRAAWAKALRMNVRDFDERWSKG